MLTSSRKLLNVTMMTVVCNGKPQQLPAGANVADLLQSLELADKPVAVEVNLQLAPREQHQSWVLAEGDELEVVTLVGGG